VAQFVDAIRRVAAGGTAMDPEVISQLLVRHRATSPVGALTPREREVLEHMAQGLSNAAIAAAMFVTEKAIGKHIGSIFGKLNLHLQDDTNRRVLAVLAFLESGG
jgi:DNA-binding NarL/FixJ family response regulator